MANRKLQAEIERVFKKVDEGVQTFEQIWDKVYSAVTTAQKEKHEGELKKEIKKLQRLRDQIKTWQGDSSIKDKTKLDSNRRTIEEKMEKFKVCEKETKTKAFSKEGLAQDRIDPKEKAKAEVGDWVREAIEKLKEQCEEMEAEIESLNSGKRKKRNDENPRVIHLKDNILRHQHHQEMLERVLRAVDNDAVTPEEATELKDSVDYYIDSNQDDPDFVEDDEMYDMLNLEAAPVQPAVKKVDKDQDDEEETPTTPSPTTSQAKKVHSSPRNSKAGKPTSAGNSNSKLPNLRTISPKNDRGSETQSMNPNSVTNSSTGPNGLSISVSHTPIQSPQKAVSPNVGKESNGSTQENAPLLRTVVMGITNGKTTTQNISQGAPVDIQGLCGTPDAPLPVATSSKPVVALDIPENVSSASIVSNNEGLAIRYGGMFPHMPEASSVLMSANMATSVDGDVDVARTSSVATPADLVQPGIPATLMGPDTSGLLPPVRLEDSIPLIDPVTPGHKLSTEPKDKAPTWSESSPELDAIEASLEYLPSSYNVSPNIAIDSNVEMISSGGNSGVSNNGNTTFARNPVETPASFPSVAAPVFDSRDVFARFDTDTLFFIFYYQQGTYQQYLAALELKRQGWRFHKKYLTWFQRHEEPKILTDEFETGTFIYFDYANVVMQGHGSGWCQRLKSEFVFEYRYLEDELTLTN